MGRRIMADCKAKNFAPTTATTATTGMGNPGNCQAIGQFIADPCFDCFTHAYSTLIPCQEFPKRETQELQDSTGSRPCNASCPLVIRLARIIITAAIAASLAWIHLRVGAISLMPPLHHQGTCFKTWRFRRFQLSEPISVSV